MKFETASWTASNYEKCYEKSFEIMVKLIFVSGENIDFSFQILSTVKKFLNLDERSSITLENLDPNQSARNGKKEKKEKARKARSKKSSAVV